MKDFQEKYKEIVLFMENGEGQSTVEQWKGLSLLNYQLSQKLKRIGRGKFNHLIISLTFPLTCGLKLPFNR
jgi:hypothetical protein